MPVEVLGYHHFSLLVRDLERAEAFYSGVLNLKRTETPGTHIIWYDLGAGQQLHLIRSNAVPDCHEGHPAMEVRDIHEAVEACRAAGATIQQDVFPRAHDGSSSAFVRDPDGNLIEFTQHLNFSVK